jgi:hypothetical protein
MGRRSLYGTVNKEFEEYKEFKERSQEPESRSLGRSSAGLPS